MMKSALSILVLVAGFLFAISVPAKVGDKYSLTVYNYGSGKEYFVQLCVNLTNGTEVKSKYIGFKDSGEVVFPPEQYKTGFVYKYREKPTNITRLNSEQSSNAPHLIENHDFPMVTIGSLDDNELLHFCYNVTGTYDESRIDVIRCP